MKHRYFRLLFAFAKVNWSAFSQYRFGSLVWLLNGILIPLIVMGIWVSVRRGTDIGISEPQIITYYVLSIIVFRITQSWSSEDLAFGIKQGIFSHLLLKPLPYKLEYMGKDLAMKGLRLLSLIPVIVVLGFVFRDQLLVNYDPVHWLLFTLALLGGICMEFLLSNVVGLSAFWLEEAYGGFVLFYLIKQLLSGAILPLMLLPIWLEKIALLLPFQFAVYFPIQVLVSPELTPQLVQQFALLIGWLIVIYLLERIVFYLGIKQYTAVGI